jgi:hypothetical protein
MNSEYKAGLAILPEKAGTAYSARFSLASKKVRGPQGMCAGSFYGLGRYLPLPGPDRAL